MTDKSPITYLIPADQHGMSLRDYFAGQAITGIAAGYWANPQMGGLNSESLSSEAYDIADAMLAQREKDGE